MDTTITIKVDDETKKRIEAQAQKYKVSTSAYIRFVVLGKIEEQEQRKAG